MRIRLRPGNTQRRWLAASFVLIMVLITIKVLELAGVIGA